METSLWGWASRLPTLRAGVFQKRHHLLSCYGYRWLPLPVTCAMLEKSSFRSGFATSFSVTSHIAMWKTRLLCFPFLPDVSMSHISIGSLCYFSYEGLVGFFILGRGVGGGKEGEICHLIHKSLWSALFMGPSHWPCLLCTFIYPLEFINYEYIRLQVHNKVSRKHILIKYPNSMSR